MIRFPNHILTLVEMQVTRISLTLRHEVSPYETK